MDGACGAYRRAASQLLAFPTSTVLGPHHPTPPHTQASVSRLLLHDLSPAAGQPGHLPPPAWAEPAPHLARMLSVDRLAVAHSQTGVGHSVRSTTRLELWDPSLEGYAGEAGSFLSR